MEPLSQVRALIDMAEDDNSEFTHCMIEDILHNLGARIDTRYNVNVTHLIWLDGKNEKILKKCLSSKIHVVSPLWVVECQQANEKVEENAWPAEITNRQAKQIDITPSPVKEQSADKADESKSVKNTSSFIQEKKVDSDQDEDNRIASKQRKATKPKTYASIKKTIVLSEDEDEQEPRKDDSEPVSKGLKTPKKKSLGAKRRPSSVTKKLDKDGDKKKQKRKAVETDREENDENRTLLKPNSTPKSQQKGEYGQDDSPLVKSKKSPGSAKKKTISSICLSHLSDFVRDAAYDMAKNHPEYVIFESSDAQYVVVEKVVRTVKVFYALAAGGWIISAEWILASVTAGRWLNPAEYEFKDLPSKRSRETHSDPNFKGLFHGERVYVRKGVEPGQSILQELFLICGAKIMPDEESASVIIAAQGESGGISPKWLLDSLIVFEKLDAEGYLAAPSSPTI